MSARAVTILISVLLVGSCSRRQAAEPAPLESPRANPSPELMITPQEIEPMAQPSRGRDLDETPSDDSKTTPQTVAEVIVDAGGIDERELRRREVERAVDGALQGSLKRLEECYAGSQQSSDHATTIRMTIHRSGYVIQPEVEGGTEAVRGCLRSVLNGLQVPGTGGDSITVQRVLRPQHLTR